MPETKQQADETEGVPDAENPVWTKERFARAMRLKDLPESLQAKLTAIQEASRKRRGLQKAPTKELISIRLSPDVLTALRATGEGWQTLIDDTLRRQFVKSGVKARRRG
jgi:uncharacterized protein (DUF4415 family)